jgi:hypothetical protein
MSRELSDEQRAIFREVWDEMQPTINQVLQLVAPTLTDFRIRGYNPKSPNCEGPGQLDIWANINWASLDENRAMGPVIESALRQVDRGVCQNAWDKIFVILGDDLEHLSFTPLGAGELYVIGILAKPVDDGEYWIFRAE